MVSLRVSSFRDLERALAALEREVKTGTVKALRKTARWGRSEILKTSRATEPRPRAEGTYEQGWSVRSRADGAEIVNPTKHAVFVEEGRRPRRRPPPIGPIRRWILRKRIARTFKAANSIAFVMARSIGRKGIKGRFVLARTMPKISEKMKREVGLVLAKAAAFPPRR